MKDKIKRAVIRLVAKKIVNRVGEEKWEESKGKIGALVGVVSFAIGHVLPEFGVNVVLPPVVFDFVAALGFGTSLYGIREAQERAEDEIHEIEAEIKKKGGA